VKQAVKQLLGRIGYRIEGTRYTPRHLYRSECLRTSISDNVICRHMFEHGQACNFIQVGAYDGVSTDPLGRYVERCGWKGVTLEPQPGPAAQLRQLYKNNPAIVVLEAAVDKERMVRTLYTVELPKKSWRHRFVRSGANPETGLSHTRNRKTDTGIACPVHSIQ
jgi:FkbM family methyltransferase